MRPVIKNKVAITSPQGFLDSSNVPSILDVDDVSYILNADINAFFISLKNVILFNAGAIYSLNEIMVNNILRRKNIYVGFCDYDKKKFELIKKYLGEEHKLTLLENKTHVELFFGSKMYDYKNILIWNDNSSLRGLILYMLLERGYTGIAAKSKEEFDSEKEYDIKIENCILGSISENIKNYTRSNIVVYIFNNFLDAERIDTFDVLSHNNYLRVGFKVFVFDCSTVVGMNPHAVNFLCRLAVSGAEYGALFVIAGFDESKLGKQIRSDLETAGFLFKRNLDGVWSDKEILEKTTSQTEALSNKKKGLTKQTIKALPIFVDSVINTIEVMTGIKAQKESVKVSKPDFKNLSGDYFAASMAFYGNIEGIIALIFKKEIAAKACSILLGTDTIKDVEILDTLGELTNILMGKTKTALSTKNIVVSMTLPRTFANINDIKAILSNRDGVEVEFKFDGSEFLFFLTS